MSVKKVIKFVKILSSLSACFLTCSTISCLNTNEKLFPKEYKTYKLSTPIYILDGDTLRFKNHSDFQSIRIFGIDTPEIYKSTKDEKLAKYENYFGFQAKNEITRLIDFKSIKIRYITQDKYQRWVCQVFNHQNIDLGEVLVKQGLARVAYISISKKLWKYWNNDSEIIKYYKKIKQDELLAKDKKIGFWKYNLEEVFHKL